jgi:glycosyltransferase involved in cell wall biosynthesis
MVPLLRHAPKWIDNILNARPLLHLAAKQAGSTRAKGLEEMTISMLMGEHGQQKDELEYMVHWLETHYKADVIHISNALLLGLAHKLKEKLKVPIVCSLQDEHVWVDVMSQNAKEHVWKLMREKAQDIDMFIAVSHYYNAFMKEKLAVADDKITTLHIGVDPHDYSFINAVEKEKNIGFLSRLCEENGLDILIDAFLLLKQKPENESVKLFLTGGSTADDKRFISMQKKKVQHARLGHSVVFMDDFSPAGRKTFFDKVSVLSVPVRNGEAFGIYLIEAMASGIPIVQPQLAAFPEIVHASGGGLLYKQNTPDELADTLHRLLQNTQQLKQLSMAARESTERNFNILELTKQLKEIYTHVVTQSKI